MVVVDPLDGSTNASRGIRWFATALCLVDEHGPAVALVADQASGERWWATRGGGAFRGRAEAPVALTPSGCRRPAEAIVGISGPPTGDYGWAQFRALGAAALDLCLVAAGVLDAYVDMSVDAHGVWDYLAGVLICREAGAVVADAGGRDLTVIDHVPGARPWRRRRPSCSTRCSPSGAADQLDGAGDLQDEVLPPAPPDDLEADREALDRDRRDGCRRAPRSPGTATPC